MPTLDKTIAHLKRLHLTCLYAQRNFRQLAASAQAAPLQQFLAEREREQDALITCLHGQITSYGGLLARHRGLLGLWRRCRHALSALGAPGDDRKRLAIALLCETEIEHDFESLLGQTLSPAFKRQLVEHHHCAQARIRQLRATRAHWPQLDALDPIADLD